MLLRLALLLVLAMVVTRGAWRVFDGVKEGLSGRVPHGPGGSAPARGIQMVRDPVCGTFVLPDHALTIVDGRSRVFFCSGACRDRYRPSTGSGRPDGFEGRANRA